MSIFTPSSISARVVNEDSDVPGPMEVDMRGIACAVVMTFLCVVMWPEALAAETPAADLNPWQPDVQDVCAEWEVLEDDGYIPGGFLSPCESHVDCLVYGGACVPGPEGEMMCTKSCEDPLDCPEGWACADFFDPELPIPFGQMCQHCVPDCEGKECGDNGCGYWCGECPPPENCSIYDYGEDGGTVCHEGKHICHLVNCTEGHCVPGLAPYYCDIDAQCLPSGTENPDNVCEKCKPSASQTGWSPVPDGTLCGAGQVCAGGKCGECTAGCEGKQCGDDGCGGSCGQCADAETCTPEGICVETSGPCPTCADVACPACPDADSCNGVDGGNGKSGGGCFAADSATSSNGLLALGFLLLLAAVAARIPAGTPKRRT